MPKDETTKDRKLSRAIAIQAAARLVGDWTKAGVGLNHNEKKVLEIAKLWSEWIED